MINKATLFLAATILCYLRTVHISLLKSRLPVLLISNTMTSHGVVSGVLADSIKPAAVSPWYDIVRDFAKHITAKHPATRFSRMYPICVANLKAKPRNQHIMDLVNRNEMPPSSQFTKIIGALQVGHRYYSPSGKTFVEFQKSSNLKVDASQVAGVVWNSGKHLMGLRRGSMVCHMKPDGNFVIQSGAKSIWTTATEGNHGAQLVIQNDGNLSVYSRAGVALWRTTYRPPKGQYTDITGVLPKRHVYSSPNGFTTLQFTPSGNLVLNRWNGREVWQSATKGATCKMQSDGNLVILNSAKTPVWSSSSTSNHSGSCLALQDDGDLAIYGGDGLVKLWASHTVFGKVSTKKTYACNRRREDYVAALKSSVSSRNGSTRPVLRDGQQLAMAMRHQAHSRMHDAAKFFDVFRVLEAWDVFAFKETWTDIDTEELRMLDGGSGIFVNGRLTTEAFAARLPSVQLLEDLLKKKSVAIVGNGRSVSGHAREIDEHPVVVRFNNFVGKSLNHKTGFKTHIHVVNAHITKSAGSDVLLLDLEGTHVWMPYCRRFNLDHKIDKVILFRPSALCTMRRLWAWTRGFLFYWFMGSLFENVDFYGMTEKDGRSHYDGGKVNEMYLEFEHSLYNEVSRMRHSKR